MKDVFCHCSKFFVNCWVSRSQTDKRGQQQVILKKDISVFSFTNKSKWTKNTVLGGFPSFRKFIRYLLSIILDPIPSSHNKYWMLDLISLFHVRVVEVFFKLFYSKNVFSNHTAASAKESDTGIIWWRLPIYAVSSNLQRKVPSSNFAASIRELNLSGALHESKSSAPHPMLFQLGDDLLVHFVSDWLDVVCLSKLDISTSCSYSRPIWEVCLRLINAKAFDGWCHCRSSLEWLIKRTLMVTSIQTLPHAALTLSDISLKGIKLHSLKSVNLNNCKCITDDGIALIAKGCPNLLTVNFRRCDCMTDVSITALALGCPQLQTIDLTSCSSISDMSLTVLAWRCQHLRSIKLKLCTAITDGGVVALALGCPALQSIDLSGCDNVTNICLRAISEKCHQLNSIHLDNCYKISDAGLKSLSAGCKNLVKIYFAACDLISDLGICALAKGCPGLVYICCKGVVRLSDVGVIALVKSCLDLHTINIRGCVRVTFAGVLGIAQGCHKLQTVDIRGCQLDMIESITALALHCPRLETFNLMGINIWHPFTLTTTLPPLF